MSSDRVVLSIQSHVTHGYVGNKAATFPLQLHGFDVDAINTVSLSNHSGYPVIRGHRMDLEEYNSIVDGLRANNFLVGYPYVLTGYINNKDVIAQVENTVAEIRRLREAAGLSDVTLFCDPVMGDDGKLYCKEDVITAYRSLLRIADVATPNGFEAGVLSGTDVHDLASARTAADWFHQQGTACVVIKSFPAANDPAHLQFLVSVAEKKTKADAGVETTGVDRLQLPPKRYVGLVPFHEGRYTGTGDVFAASLVAFARTEPIDVAVGKSMAVLQELILATRKRGGDGASSLNSRELRVTDSPESLLRPQVHIEVRPLPES